MLSTSLRRRHHQATPAALSRPRDQRATTGLCVLGALTFGASLPSTMYPGYQHAFRADTLTMTLVHAVFALVSVPALLLLGPVSDTFGARPVLRAGLVAAALGSVCLALAPGVGWLVVGRAAQGLALGATTGAAAALVSEGAGRPGLRNGAVRTGVVFVSGTAAGAAGGGFLLRYAPAPHLLPFALHLLLLAFVWHRVARLVPSVPAAARATRWRPNVPRVPRGMRALFTTSSAVGFLAWTTAGLFLALIPTLPALSGRHDTAVTGGVLGAVLACSALSQPVAGRLGARRAQLAGLTALLASLSLLSLTAGRSAPVTLAAAVVAGIGHGLAHAGAAAVVDGRAPGERRGAITGALYLSFFLGAGLPAVAVGLLTLSLPVATATSVVASAAAVAVLVTSVAVAEVGRPVRPLPKGTVSRPKTKPVRDDVSA